LLIVLVVVVVAVLGHGSMLAKAFLRGKEGERRKQPVLVPKKSRTKDDHEDETSELVRQEFL
jgi:hypothetical protein